MPRISIILLTFFSLIFSVTADATNGYFTHGLGVKNKSTAGAGTATPDEAIASANNPAAAAMMDTRLEAGLSIFSPRRGFDVTPSLANGNGGAFTIDSGVDSDRKYFPVPYIAWNWRRTEDDAIAISLYGRGGMNTKYQSGSATFDPDGPGPSPVMSLPGVFGAGDLGVDFSQLFVDAAYARKLGSISWGVAAVLAVQSMELDGIATFAPYTRTFAASGGTQFPDHLSDNGYELSYGGGIKLGILWSVNETVRLGASYQSEISMSEFDDYSDLFAESGGFDVPENMKVGASWDVTPQLSLHTDIERTSFGQIASVGTPMARLFACPTAGAGGTNLDACLGGKKGAGFGWDDVTTYKFGVTYRPSTLKDWELRAGYSHAAQPVNSADVLFNIIAPGVIEDHFTFGVTTQVGGKELSFSFMYAPENTVSGANPFDPTQRIALHMHQYELEFGLAF